MTIESPSSRARLWVRVAATFLLPEARVLQIPSPLLQRCAFVALSHEILDEVILHNYQVCMGTVEIL